MKTFRCKYCGEKNERQFSGDKRIFCDKVCSGIGSQKIDIKQHLKRLNDITWLWNEGVTLQQIGNIHHLTRERIRQILISFDSSSKKYYSLTLTK